MRITLCGSTRFEPLFHEWNHRLAIAGHTVYSLSIFAREAKDIDKDDKPIITDAEKITLDLVHLDKILNSDAIVVLNEGGYVGFSTGREIQWARMKERAVYWLESWHEDGMYNVWDLIENKFKYVTPAPSSSPLRPGRPNLDDDIPF